MRSRGPCVVTAEGMVMIGEVALDMPGGDARARQALSPKIAIGTRPSRRGRRIRGQCGEGVGDLFIAFFCSRVI